MDEHEFYEPIGAWLIENKDCNTNDYFLGYTPEPEIRVEGNGSRRPDVVGVHYEWSGNTNGSQDFHHHVVEVKSNLDPGSIDTLIGQIQSDRYYVENGNVAADRASYYVAVPTTDVPSAVQKQATDNGIGILILQTVGSDDEDVLVRETKEPTSVSTERIGVLSNSDQSSKGNFKRAIKRTAVLSTLITDYELFLEEEIKPQQEKYTQKRNREKFIQYIDSTEEAQEVAKEILEFLEGISQASVAPPSSSIKKTPSIDIKVSGKTKCKLIPQTRNFKIQDKDGDLLFRIEGREDMLSNVEGVETVSEVKTWVQKNLQ